MSQKLKFGGPNLPAGHHTWYEHARTGAIVQPIRPGDEVDIADVVNPDQYVRNLQAVVVGAAPKEAKPGS